MAPRILIAHYSRNGHTARLANTLGAELKQRGAEVAYESIRPRREWNKWLLPIPLLPLLPLLPIYLGFPSFRRFWHRIYFQPRQAIAPLKFPSIREFDHVLIGTPKWLYVSYPVAEWLHRIEGLEKMTVSSFATFCGPPLQVFELEMLFEPLVEILARRGATAGPRLAVSSNYHPYFFFGEMEKLFRWISRRFFRRPLNDFTQDGDVGQAEIQRFCEQVMQTCKQNRHQQIP